MKRENKRKRVGKQRVGAFWGRKYEKFTWFSAMPASCSPKITPLSKRGNCR